MNEAEEGIVACKCLMIDDVDTLIWTTQTGILFSLVYSSSNL